MLSASDHTSHTYTERESESRRHKLTMSAQIGDKLVILGPTLDEGWAMARKGDRVGAVPLTHLIDLVEPVSHVENLYLWVENVGKSALL
jgi:hypothetical protein